MIPNEQTQTVDAIGNVKSVADFTFTADTQARILMSLSDKMYTRKQLAVIREYCNNANDAHIVAGKPTSELIVTLPTIEHMQFKVRDFGAGLTLEQVRNVYCIFGESTKRNSNQLNGVLGYGCKSGFAESDSFTVTSWVNGEKAIYNCIRGDNRTLHRVVELFRGPSDEPSGIEVCVPVSQSSLWTFHREAANLFKYWSALPQFVNFNPSDHERMMNFINNPPTLSGKGWNIRPRSDGSPAGVALMGNVPYHIDWNLINSRMALTSETRPLFTLLQNNDVVLTYEMGEVTFADNRESLDYTEQTIKAIETRVYDIFDKIVESIQSKFDGAASMWEAKKIHSDLFNSSKNPIEDIGDNSKKVRFLDGSLGLYGQEFSSQFSWNGFKLESGDFVGINGFDNAFPAKEFNIHRMPVEPLMVTYFVKNTHLKTRVCNQSKHNTIAADDRVVVVINDTKTKSGLSVVARYLLNKPQSIIKRVHVLTFVDDVIQTAFYKHFNFDTVPTLKVSEIIEDAKAWKKSNSSARAGGSRSGSYTGTRPFRYIDLDLETVKENDIPAREIEDETYFLELDGNSSACDIFVADGSTKSMYSSTFIKHLKQLIDAMGLDITRVYAITKQTRASKWFNSALEDGQWINLWKHVRENSDSLGDPETLLNAIECHEFDGISGSVCKRLIPLIMDKESPSLPLLNVPSRTQYKSQYELGYALKSVGLFHDIVKDKSSTLQLSKIRDEFQTHYPFADLTDYRSGYTCSDERVKALAKYINAMDLYVDLGGDSEATPTETTISDTLELAIDNQ